MEGKQLPHNHGKGLEAAIANLPEEDSCQEAAAAFQQLSDPSRLRIFLLLCHCEECGINIAAAVDMSPAAVSHHLKSLKLHGLIKSHRKGKEVYYTLGDTPRATLMHRMADEYFHVNCNCFN